MRLIQTSVERKDTSRILRSSRALHDHKLDQKSHEITNTILVILRAINIYEALTGVTLQIIFISTILVLVEYQAKNRKKAKGWSALSPNCRSPLQTQLSNHFSTVGLCFAFSPLLLSSSLAQHTLAQRVLRQPVALPGRCPLCLHAASQGQRRDTGTIEAPRARHGRTSALEQLNVSVGSGHKDSLVQTPTTTNNPLPSRFTMD